MRVCDRDNPTCERKIKHPIYPPHEVLEAIGAASPAIIDRALLGPNGIDGVRAFWQSNANCDWCREHPAQELGGDELTWTLPVELFGDDAGIWKHEKLLILSWRSALWQSAKTWWTCFLITVLPLACVIPGKTLQDLHRAVTWSFRACLAGAWPRRTHTGAIMRKVHGCMRYAKRGWKFRVFRAALVRTTGDYKYLAETFRLRAYSHRDCCHRCAASKADQTRLYTSTGEHATWRAFPRTHAEYMAERGPDACALCDIPGWRLDTVKTDLMHNLFLGSALHVIGSVLVELVEEGWFGNAPLQKQQRLTEAYLRFKAWLKLNRITCSAGRFTMEGLGWTSRYRYPEYKSKAHNARVVLAWLQTETRSNATSVGTTTSQMRATMVWCLAQYCYEVDTQPREHKLQQHVADSMASLGYSFLSTYMWMAREALRRQRCLYAVKPKLHQPARYLSRAH